MIRFRCAQCGKPIVVADGLAGKTGRCPGCGERCVVPAQSEPGLEPPAAKPAPSAAVVRKVSPALPAVIEEDERTVFDKAAKGTLTVSVATVKLAGRGAVEAGRVVTTWLKRSPLKELPRAEPVVPKAIPTAQPVYPRPVPQYLPGYYPPVMQQQAPIQNVTQTVIVQTGAPPPPTNGLATAALVMALLGILFCWIPLLGLLTIPFLLLTILLAFLGLVVGLLRRGAGVGASLLAGVLSVAAIVVSVGSTAAAIGGAAHSLPPAAPLVAPTEPVGDAETMAPSADSAAE